MKQTIIKAVPEKVEILKKEFGRKISELRKLNSLTQEDLASICDTSIATVKRVECGNSPLKIESIIILSKVFKMEIAELINFCIPNKEIIFYNHKEQTIV